MARFASLTICFRDALERCMPGHLQIGGGITFDNAKEWLDAGASKVDL